MNCMKNEDIVQSGSASVSLSESGCAHCSTQLHLNCMPYMYVNLRHPFNPFPSKASAFPNNGQVIVHKNLSEIFTRNQEFVPPPSNVSAMFPLG